MKITNCFLDSTSPSFIQSKNVTEPVMKKNMAPLWGERKENFIDTVVIHYISAIETAQKTPFDIHLILEIFYFYEVSTHYLIDREGSVYYLVPEEKKAWHCGGSKMPEPDKREGVNEFSIGIELIATHSSGFTEPQYGTLGNLCSDIEKRWPIKNYLGHQDVAGHTAVALGLRKDIKEDPGPLFNWELFYKMKGKKKSSGQNSGSPV